MSNPRMTRSHPGMKAEILQAMNRVYPVLRMIEYSTGLSSWVMGDPTARVALPRPSLIDQADDLEVEHGAHLVLARHGTKVFTEKSIKNLNAMSRSAENIIVI